MKNYAKFVIAFSAFVIVGIIAFIIIAGDMNSVFSESSDSVIILNDIAKAAEDNWDSPHSLGDKDYGVDFIVFDMNGTTVYKTDGADKKINKLKADGNFKVENAIKSRLPYKYIVKDDVVVGSVVVLENTDNAFAKMKLRLVIGLSVMAIFLVIGALIYGGYIKRSIVQPFERMESFAGKVAEGKLDEPLMMEKDNMFGIFTESFDIMREELAQSKKRETALQRKERELVASLSHDLKTPITGIKLTAELLKAKVENGENGESEDMLGKLDNIYQKADQMDKLISDLFSSTLDDLGEIKVECQDEESRVIEEIVKRNDDKGLVVMAKAPDIIVNIDKVRLSQVIGNIITNSYKYAGTKIDVSFMLVDTFLEMKIQDYGPGVSEDELSRITNKFYRGNNAEVKQKEGSGLGLYIAQSLMRKMNGELMCESDGDGFTAILYIPLS